MWTALWLVTLLFNCQRFVTTSTGQAGNNRSPVAQMTSNLHSDKLFAALQQQIPEIPQALPLPRIPNFEHFGLPFTAPPRARQPSRTRSDQKIQQELKNDQKLAEEELQKVADTEHGIQQVEEERSKDVQRRPHGVSYKFCDQFGCQECTPPKGAKCCKGFKYDNRASRCRELL